MLKSKGIKPVTYVGYTNNIKKRISLHNSGKGEKFKSKNEAISREYYIKNNRTLRDKIKNENFNTTSL